MCVQISYFLGDMALFFVFRMDVDCSFDGLGQHSERNDLLLQLCCGCGT